MSNWNIKLTPEFRQDVRDIHSYMANTLLAPETALKQVDRILGEVETLTEMPHRKPLYEREPWKSRGLRKLVVDNFVVFYLTNEKQKDVAVLHVFYCGRNITSLLEEFNK